MFVTEKCGFCEKKIAETIIFKQSQATGESRTRQDGSENHVVIIYCCPNCKAVLGVQMDSPHA